MLFQYRSLSFTPEVNSNISFRSGKKISIPQQENIFALNVEACNLQETSIVIIVVMTFLFLNIKRIFVKRMHFRQAEGRYTVKILIFSKLT